MGVGVLSRRVEAPPLPLPQLSLTVMAFGSLPFFEAWITAVWSLISILVVWVAMVIEFT